MMKKVLIVFLFIFLVACEPTVENPVVDIDCNIYPTHVDCKDDIQKDDQNEKRAEP